MILLGSLAILLGANSRFFTVFSSFLRIFVSLACSLGGPCLMRVSPELLFIFQSWPLESFDPCAFCHVMNLRHSQHVTRQNLQVFFFLDITIIYNYMILYGLWSMYKFSSCFFLNMPPTELRISVSRRRRSGKRRSIAPSILPRGICWSPKGRAMIWWGIQRCQKWPWGRFDEDDISWNISYTSNIIYII